MFIWNNLRMFIIRFQAQKECRRHALKQRKNEKPQWTAKSLFLPYECRNIPIFIVEYQPYGNILYRNVCNIITVPVIWSWYMCVSSRWIHSWLGTNDVRLNVGCLKWENRKKSAKYDIRNGKAASQSLSMWWCICHYSVKSKQFHECLAGINHFKYWKP